MTAPVVTTDELLARIQELEAQISDQAAGIPSHTHKSTAGKTWRCTSPYCERGGGNTQDNPVGPPNERTNFEQYRRT